ncbi:MAG: hypothetical protein HY925_10885 [Elusimicrobia bacterium]|nr:hypothetical protein [Elusimicrobiota bacterium]
MKTRTRAAILAFIREHRSARPIELVRFLRISAQAVHRHLRSMTASGELERIGAGPKTRYTKAGAPDFSAALHWFSARQAPENPGESWCDSRDSFAARLPRLARITQTLQPNDAALLISIAGELGNNAFDHNLGSWKDVPGCWFEAQATGGKVWLCVADRGQGIFSSLARAHPEIRDGRTALSTAFEKRVSGRAPEQRGNGLKYVRGLILQSPGRGIACRSGDETLAYGELGARCLEEVAPIPGDLPGTIITVVWSLP